jgi:hypothetical protein
VPVLDCVRTHVFSITMSSDEGSDWPSESLTDSGSSEEEQVMPARKDKAKKRPKSAKKGKRIAKAGKKAKPKKAKMAAKQRRKRESSTERSSSEADSPDDSDVSVEHGSEDEDDSAAPMKAPQQDQLLQIFQWLVKMKATDAVVGDGPSTSAGTTSAAPDPALPALFAEMQGQLVSKKEGKDIHPALANLLNPVMRSEPDGDKMKELVQGYPRPENVPNLTVPELNDNLHLSTGPGKLEERLTDVQEWLSGLCAIILRILDDIGSNQTDSRPIRDYHVNLFDALRLGMASFSNLNQCRKDNLWNDLGHPISLLCKWTEPVGVKKMFDCKINKRIKEIRESAIYSKKRKQDHG